MLFSLRHIFLLPFTMFSLSILHFLSPRAAGIGGEAPTCQQLQIAVISLSVLLGFVLIGGLWLLLHVASKARQAIMDAEKARVPSRYRRQPYVAFYGNLGGTATTGGLTHGNGNRSNVNGHTVFPYHHRFHPELPRVTDDPSPPSSEDDKPEDDHPDDQDDKDSAKPKGHGNGPHGPIVADVLEAEQLVNRLHNIFHRPGQGGRGRRHRSGSRSRSGGRIDDYLLNHPSYVALASRVEAMHGDIYQLRAQLWEQRPR